MTGTLEADWDVTVNPLETPPPDLKMGENVGLLLYIHAASGVEGQDGPFFQFNAKFFVFDILHQQEEKLLIQLTILLKVQLLSRLVQ